MKRELLGVGDRLVSVWLPGDTHYNAGKQGIVSIGVNQLPGPMGFYLVANIICEDSADIIVPLHMAEGFTVSNP